MFGYPIRKWKNAIQKKKTKQTKTRAKQKLSFPALLPTEVQNDIPCSCYSAQKKKKVI